MDDRGRIHMVEDEADARKRGLTPLSPSEYQAMLGVPEEYRPIELALSRFIEERKRLKAPHGPEVRNAFRLGWLAAQRSD